jgi:3-hydroxyisobutyrate dehydrogenase-like beta-hydroxyacid dehydrogenase
MSDVTVIGLGSMGVTLARLLLESGRSVTLWNRTADKSAELVARGAVLAPSAAAAVAASPIEVVCVYDYAAANAILGTDEVAAALPGRVLVQLTTGSPKEARESERWARERDALYLDGAIQAAPSQMAQPDTTILLSGPEPAYGQALAVMQVFGGNLKYLGQDAGLASAMDLATLSYVYGAIIGFMHGALIAETEGFGVDAYGAIVAEIAPSFGAFLKHEGAVIQSGDFAISESPLRISVEATERMAVAARETGISDEFPAFTAGLFQRAARAGLGEQELAALIKVLRAPR